MIIFEYLVFPGIIFTASAAVFVSWFDRKLSALIQRRKGPPLFQPLYDFLKLMKKETVLSRGTSPLVFFLSPAMAFASLILISLILMKTNLTGIGFVGDVFVVFYLLLIPSFAEIMGGAASANPLLSFGVSREMKKVLSYEFPFILALTVVIIKTGSINISEIIGYQRTNKIILGSFSGALAFIVAVLSLQAKIAQISFDVPEQEIMGGAIIEYSGPPLAIFILSRWIMSAILPFFTVIFFMGGIASITGILKYLIVVVMFILIKSMNPRPGIGRTLRELWVPITAVSIFAVILAFLGI